jgi:hypothetical protein
MDFSKEKLTYEYKDWDTKALLRELILYIATRSQLDPWFGKTKLVKLLYLADFGSFREYGIPITGHRYIAMPNGPFPDDLNALLDDMVEKREIIKQMVPIPGYNNAQERIIPCREANPEVFKPYWESIAFVDGLIHANWKKTGSRMAKGTHGIAWKVTEQNQPIPYESSIIKDDNELTQEDIEILEEIAEKYGFVTR